VKEGSLTATWNTEYTDVDIDCLTLAGSSPVADAIEPALHPDRVYGVRTGDHISDRAVPAGGFQHVR
jgi:hypothetical protein